MKNRDKEIFGLKKKRRKKFPKGLSAAVDVSNKEKKRKIYQLNFHATSENDICL